MAIPLVTVDAFTSAPFSGNPAGVCLLSEARDAEWMQHVAKEVNLGATAFLVPRQAASAYDLRWFTAKAELVLCGHGTLASAHVLWESGRAPRQTPIEFHTQSGVLTAKRDAEAIQLDFPALSATPLDNPPEGLLEALAVRVLGVHKSRLDHLVELESEAAVRELSPDFARLRSVATRGIIVTSRAGSPGIDFVSRFFAPSVGINEDPVTGSAHCCLAPFWSSRLGQRPLTARQLSARGGELTVRLDGDRVRLSCRAVTVFRGELFV